ncbi:MAG TPA: phage tail sheath C-terminal domain-containing protein [Motilibacterales bacterium]|nr:phage tail sheath C-terminal domain-containing protein [Motilibacterales bacterium]
MTAGLSLGAPGVYQVTSPAATSGVQPIRLDAAGFVGMAFRGPGDEPVRVTSWSQFVEVFGGVTDLLDDVAVPCPGYLPRAVRAFFDQGGQVAWVCRVVPVADDAAATARLTLTDGRDLVAASEGRWGARLEVTLSFDPGPQLPGVPEPVVDEEMVIANVAPLPAGSLLVVGPCPGHPAGSLHRMTGQTLRPLPGGGRQRVITVDPPVPRAARGHDGRVVDVRTVTGTLTVLDRDPLHRRQERITGLGLDPAHPRYPARPLPPNHPGYPGTVLTAESRLVRTADGWAERIEPADGTLAPMATRAPVGGADRFDAVSAESFFDSDTPSGDLLDERDDHRGVDRVSRVADLGLLCVPDLTWAGSGHFLDPQNADELTEISRRQASLVAVAELRRRFVVLLDAPARLSLPGLARWRAGFDSAYAAAYHPWLGVPGDGPGRCAVPLPPSAVAAGVIASRERRLGLPWGPANELAMNAVTAEDLVPDAVHDELHRMNLNVFQAERDGFRLTSARTLSLDPRYRQLSVRRLMTMITLSVERQANSLVFEPNTPGLRALVNHVLTQFLRELFRRGAFAGDTEQTSFFVRCDDVLNPPQSQAQGRLITEIGVAPSSPLEYLVLRISQELDGTSTVTPVVGPVAALPGSGSRTAGAS